MKRIYFMFVAIHNGLLGCLVLFEKNVMTQQPLRYSCSAQVYKAFENKRLDAFTLGMAPLSGPEQAQAQ